MHKRVLVLLTASFLTLVASAQSQRKPKPCTKAQHEQVENEASNLRSWDALYASYRRYGHCDDVDAAEGYDESIARILVDHWKTLPRLAQLIRRDKAFARFAGVGPTAGINDLRKIKENATHRCPAGLTDLCHRIAKQADSGLEENGQKP